MAQLSTRNNSKELFIPAELKAEVSWRFFIFALTIFAIAFFTYIGMEYGYKTYLAEQIAVLDSKIHEKPKFGADSEKNIVSFYSQIVNLKRLLSGHTSGANILAFLEKTTHPLVAYTSVGFTMEPDQMIVNGVTNSYEVVVKQLDFYEKSEEVRKAVISNIVLDKGVVRFTITLTFEDSFLFLKQSN